MIRCATILLAVALLFSAGCGGLDEPATRSERIISIAPNTTEILYALGLGDRVVGVSRFCNYPSEVEDKPVVGGLYDPNWEKIAMLRPDFVVGLDTQQDIAGHLKQLHIPFLGVSHEHIGEILEAILMIGEACGAEEQAEQLVSELRREMGRIRSPSGPPALSIVEKRASRRDVPTVLVCISRDETANRCYIAARNTFYDELIELTGGVNACTETRQKYPEISPEGLIALNPDIIIDIGPTAGLDAWRHYLTLPAVQNNRITIIPETYASVPGPRFVKLLENFKEAIQP